MNKSIIFAGLAALGLAACEAPAPGLTISPEALAQSDTLTAEVVSPRVTPAVAIQTFDQFCGRFPGNPAGTRRAVQSDGYFLLGSGTADGLEMWATSDGRPLVATGRRDGAEVCMILIAENSGLGAAASRYIVQKHGTDALSMGSMQVGADTAENVYIIPANPPVIYFTLLQVEPALGRVHAFAVVTE